MTLLSSPNICGNELKYVSECLNTGWVSSVGSYVTRFENELSKFTGSKFGVATSSGTTALHIMLLLAGVKPSDYVIVPNITFVATLNSIKYLGAEPLIVDVDDENWQMDLGLLETFLKEKTTIVNNELFFTSNNRRIAAILPVHILGYSNDMERLLTFSKTFRIPILEDASESLGSYFRNKHTGTFGLAGCISFNGNKILTTGGGGMIITDNEEFASKAKHLTTQAKADALEYYHDEVGYNYRLVNVLAAIGVAQLEKLPEFIEKKRFISNYYKNNLDGIGDISFPTVIKNTTPNNWLFTIRTKRKNVLLDILNRKELQSRSLWVPMNELPAYEKCIYVSEKNVSRDLYASCLSIPCSTNISERELENVAKTIIEVF